MWSMVIYQTFASYPFICKRIFVHMRNQYTFAVEKATLPVSIINWDSTPFTITLFVGSCSRACSTKPS